MIKIKFPEAKLHLDPAIKFCSSLWELAESDDYEFDFEQMGHVEPFTLTFVSAEIKRFIDSKPNATFSFINHEDKSYVAHMGFFKAFGLEHTNEAEEADGNSTHIPLTILNVSDIQQEALDEYSPVGDIIEAKSEQIAKLLTQLEDGEVVDMLTFTIREMLRNVVEHSGSNTIQYCGQYWPTKSLVEVAVLDTGHGIKTGLASNPYVEPKDELEALQYALMPGISGKMFKGVKKRKNDAWQNSGFGLYMTSRICRNGGTFFVASNDKGIYLTSKSKDDLNLNFKGTALRLRIDVSKIESCSAMLSQYKNEGFAAAKEFAGSDAITPSMASTMLARDFQKESDAS